MFHVLLTLHVLSCCKQESGSNHVELKAMGKAINKAVTIAEILKRKMPLHQITTLSSCEHVKLYEPLEEGLDSVVNQHYESCLSITLSRDLTGIDVKDKGYQVRCNSENLRSMQPLHYTSFSSTSLSSLCNIATAFNQ